MQRNKGKIISLLKCAVFVSKNQNLSKNKNQVDY